MRKEYFMMFLILIIVISGHCITQIKTEKAFQKIEHGLNDLKNSLVRTDEGIEDSKEKIKIIDKIWNSEFEELACYMEHDELEKIGVQLSIINASIETESYEDAIMEIDRCIFLIEHLEDKEDLKLVNMF